MVVVGCIFCVWLRLREQTAGQQLQLLVNRTSGNPFSSHFTSHIIVVQCRLLHLLLLQQPVSSSTATTISSFHCCCCCRQFFSAVVCLCLSAINKKGKEVRKEKGREGDANGDHPSLHKQRLCVCVCVCAIQPHTKVDTKAHPSEERQTKKKSSPEHRRLFANHLNEECSILRHHHHHRNHRLGKR